MKIVWEESDIVVGTKYGRPDIKEIWMIGYIASEASSSNRVSISMSDGMVTLPSSPDAMAHMLTAGRYVPIGSKA